MRYLGAMTVVEDPDEVARAGGWILEATSGWAVVGSLVPEVFESYARVFHPAMREADERDLPLRSATQSRTGTPVCTGTHGRPSVEVRWTEVAEANGTIAHPAMEWTAITGDYRYDWHGQRPGIWDQVPWHGSLPLRLARRLSNRLVAFTDTAELCWGAAWEGEGNMVGLRSDLKLPRLEIPNRPMILGSGPLSSVAARSFTDGYDPWDREEHPQFAQRYRSPSLWWPNDRSWCVATDVDLQSTYIGASADCINRLLEDDDLEVMQVTADQSVTIDADTINPTPAGDKANR